MAELSTDIREIVRERYARAARAATAGDPLPLAPPDAEAGCCGSEGSCGCGSDAGAWGAALYEQPEREHVPASAISASLGCGVPTAVADLRDGEVVLDLGSGAGADVLISARRVAPSGRAIGLDMTDEMLELARANAAQAGVTNVEFVKGYLEDMPLANDSVDVIISNCVINLSTDKGRVLREAFRVLKPGGRFAVADVVVDGPVPDHLRQQIELWVGCIAGALERRDYLAHLEAAGFVETSIESTRYYSMDDMGDPVASAWLAAQPAGEQERLGRAFFGAFVRARKPGA
jgi:arsenite methyltransferase